MAANSEITVQVNGLAELRAQLMALPDKLRRQALRNALAAGARLVRDEARQRAPVLQKPDPRRKPGTVRNAIRVRTSKRDKAEGNVGVFVNVKPLSKKQVQDFKAATRKGGGKNPDDPFYWRWLEFGRQGRARREARRALSLGTVKGRLRVLRSRKALRAVSPLPAIGFLQASTSRLMDALRRIEKVLAPSVQRILDRQANQ